MRKQSFFLKQTVYSILLHILDNIVFFEHLMMTYDLA
jgi:hypothetical protein